MLKIATEYYRHGFNVIPLEYKSKVPPKGFNLIEHFRRKTTMEEIKTWFSKVNRNIAIVTGKVSRLIVIDIDSEEGIWHLTRELSKKGLELPETAKVKTNGGYHLYFRLPEGEEVNCRIKILPGVDIKAEGGYVVAPPSIHPNGTQYFWQVPLKEIKVVPSRVLDFIKEMANVKKHETKITNLYSHVKEGERNVALTRLTGSWFRDGLSYAEALELAKTVNQRFDPPLPEKEVEAVVNSIYKRHLRSVEEKLKPTECYVNKIPFGFKITFPFIDTEAYITQLAPERADLIGYLEVKTVNPAARSKVLYQGRFNFNASRSATELEKTLKQAYKSAEDILPWKAFVETLRTKVKELLKEESKVETFDLEEDEEPVQHLIYPFIIKNTINALYGEGASGKTTFAVGLALDLITREIDFDPEGFETHKVLYLDYEDQRDFIKSQVKKIVNGYCLNKNLVRNSFHYRKCTLPLNSEVDTIYELTQKENYGLVIIDSVGRACDGDVNTAEAINSFFRAVEAIGTTTLLIHHTPKSESAKDTPYGSAYFTYNVRNMFYISKLYSGSDDAIYTLLMQKKCNTKPIKEPLIYKIAYVEQTIMFARVTRNTLPQNLRRSQHQDIVSLLRSGPKTAKEISDLLGKGIGTVKARLSELKRKGEVENANGVWYLNGK